MREHVCDCFFQINHKYYAYIIAYVCCLCVWPISFLHNFIFMNVAILTMFVSRKGETSMSAWFTIAYGSFLPPSLSLSLSLFYLFSFSIRLPLFYVSAIVIKSVRRTEWGLLQLSLPRIVPPSLFNALAVRRSLLSYRPSIPPPVIRPSVSPLRVTLFSTTRPPFPRHCSYVMKRA